MNFDLDKFLPYRLSLATNTLSQALAKDYAAFDITRTQWRVLAVLGAGLEGEQDWTAGAIAHKTMMDKTTLSRAIKNLIERGLVKRKAAQDDGRASPLALTAKGRKLFEKIVPIALAHEERIVGNISNDDLKTLERILGALLVHD
ncbi:MAG: MarR family transcriptional regulator [Robiginitomaculum sp.]|nr:MAG: MarR family transcriptional regulator [Robiginitomaculum sp.]